ncbi:Testican-3 [Anabarilius grahami]|uniref:Testican-3 n=1 Tax=Anabarilius grahami TaxID=495550 RepID=A0A3N0XH13_ANAGA|nr:Testican-3 [Anabarilius grahami]
MFIFACVSALDPAKDPCLKMKCGRHKVCVAEDYQTPTCVSQRRMSFKDMNLNSPLLKCQRCPVVHPSPVCGTDGHTYSTKVKDTLPVSCISGKQISVKCPGQCPCLSGNTAEKRGPELLTLATTTTKTECRFSSPPQKDWELRQHSQPKSSQGQLDQRTIVLSRKASGKRS